MSCPSSDSEKTNKKSKKLKPRNGTKKTKKTSTNCSGDVNPPSTLTSLDSAIIKWNQEEPRECEPYVDGNYSKMPYEAPNEVNFVGGIGANVGHLRSKKFIDRTTTIQQIFNMRNDNRTLYNFCEDPKLTNNIPPRGNESDIEGDKLGKDPVHRIGAIQHEQLPKHEEQVDRSTDDEPDREIKSDLIVEDSQFTDNKQTNLEIRKQYLEQKRILWKQKLETEVPANVMNEYRREKFKLSEYFDIDMIPEEEDAGQIPKDWTEKYKVEAHPCDLKFGRPMPEVIPINSETEKLAFLTRTLDKPRNIEKLDAELRMYTESVEENVKKDFPDRETVREMTKILEKQMAQNLSIELALKDFDEFLQNSSALNVVDCVVDEKSANISDDCRRKNLKAAMKEYEEKILNQLLDLDESNSAQYTPEEVQLSSNEETRKRSPSAHQDINFPIDFTYAFETNRNKNTDAKRKQRNREIIKKKSSDSTNLKNKSNVQPKETRSDHSEKEKVEDIGKLKEVNEIKDLKQTESFCTNFTDDSGSFIVVQGKQLHLDHLQTKKITKIKSESSVEQFNEYLTPYEVLPLKEAKKLNRRDPKLVPTFDIKDRLKVNAPQFDEERLGVKNKKYLSQLATEWDEYYQKEILNRPRIRRFKPKTTMKQIVDSLRLKYESIYKREYLTEKTIIIEQEKMFTKRAEEFRDFCLSFFSNLTTISYRQSMAKIQDLRPMYELNDELTSELTSLQNKLIQLKTAIIRTEGKVREATILQNVSYLMKDPHWRERNDWIHKKTDGSLETLKESMENRMTTNLRKRDNDSVWEIKEFFEKNIFNNKRPALICFESTNAIVDTITDFKIQLYLSLLKLDLSTWTLMNLTHAFNTYTKWSTDFIEHRKKYVEARCAKKYFLDICATNMKKDAAELINGKLVETISEKTLRTLEPLCNTLFVNVIPKNIQEQLEGGDILSKFRLIISHAMNMLEQMDAIPSAKRKEIEEEIRKENGFIKRRTDRAVDLEMHIAKQRKIMIKHSTPPFRRQPRTGKLPRSYPTPKSKSVEKQAHSDDSHEAIRPTITEKDFELFMQESPTEKDFYLDSKFFGGDPQVPNMDFLPEIKSNINEFIVDIKNVLDKWERNKQETYLEDAHNTWVTTFGESK